LEYSGLLAAAIRTYEQRAADEDPTLQNFMFVIPKVCLKPLR
jgi:hypothetical protein